jgi:hypothetical protein
VSEVGGHCTRLWGACDCNYACAKATNEDNYVFRNGAGSDETNNVIMLTSVSRRKVTGCNWRRLQRHEQQYR